MKIVLLTAKFMIKMRAVVSHVILLACKSRKAPLNYIITDNINLPLGVFGKKFSVRSLALTYSPVPSIQMYVAWILSSGWGRLRNFSNIFLSSLAFGECPSDVMALACGHKAPCWRFGRRKELWEIIQPALGSLFTILISRGSDNVHYQQVWTTLWTLSIISDTATFYRRKPCRKFGFYCTVGPTYRVREHSLPIFRRVRITMEGWYYFRNFFFFFGGGRHSEDRASWYILIIKANEMHYFSNLFLINNSTGFGQIYCPSSGVSTLYTQQ